MLPGLARLGPCLDTDGAGFIAASSLAVLQAFLCQDLGDGLNLLVADYNFDCPAQDKSSFLFIWAVVFVFVYPFGTLTLRFVGVLPSAFV